MPKPIIVLAPGSFCLPEFYDSIFEVVRDRGHEIFALHVPSTGFRAREGRPGAPPTMYDDAKFIAKEVTRLADEGRDVVLIGHSYGGITISECAKGLSKEARQKEGKQGGLVNLAYMTCLVPAIGGSARDLLGQVSDEHKVDMKVNDEGWMEQNKPEHTAAICFSEGNLEEGTAWVKTFANHSAVSFTNPLTYAGYKEIPCSWLLCERDLCIPAKIQQWSIDMIEKESGRKVDVTRIPADHIPHISFVKETIDWIVGLGDKMATP